jgi:UDP-2,3-diacylglucosamine pyrophosphatase LpxH
MEEYVYVISDLHLGGRPADGGDRGFQLCVPAAQKLLAGFVTSLVTRHAAPARTELVINGDFVDFLAEEEAVDGAGGSTDRAGSDQKRTYSAFSSDAETARSKLQHVTKACGDIFAALRAYLHAGHRLTLLLGNHDLELSLPPVRRYLEHVLTDGRSCSLTWLVDGEAYARDGFLIEHGNRYDGWNAVDHGALRAFRSAMTRGEQASFDPPPGSHLVVEIMNELKEEFPFVDLLKPENEAALPALLALRPSVREHVQRIAKLRLEAAWVEPRPGAPPERTGYIAGTTVAAPSYEQQARHAALVATRNLLRGELADAAPRTTTMESLRALWHAMRSDASSDDGLQSLETALRTQRATIERCYSPFQEEPKYRKAAERLATKAGVIIFGHTHLPKAIPLDNGALYLNTGTWCPTIGISPAVFKLEGKEFRAELEGIVRTLRLTRREGWTLDCRAARIHVRNGSCHASLESISEDSMNTSEGSQAHDR